MSKRKKDSEVRGEDHVGVGLDSSVAYPTIVSIISAAQFISLGKLRNIQERQSVEEVYRVFAQEVAARKADPRLHKKRVKKIQEAISSIQWQAESTTLNVLLHVDEQQISVQPEPWELVGFLELILEAEVTLKHLNRFLRNQFLLGVVYGSINIEE